MKLQRLSTKETEAEAARRGWRVESNQHGIQRVEIGDAVITSGSTYASVELSIPAPPEKETKYRLDAVLVGSTGPVRATLGYFDTDYDATEFARKAGLENPQFEVVEDEVEVQG